MSSENHQSPASQWRKYDHAVVTCTQLIHLTRRLCVCCAAERSTVHLMCEECETTGSHESSLTYLTAKPKSTRDSRCWRLDRKRCRERDSCLRNIFEHPSPPLSTPIYPVNLHTTHACDNLGGVKLSQYPLQTRITQKATSVLSRGRHQTHAFAPVL